MSEMPLPYKYSALSPGPLEAAGGMQAVVDDLSTYVIGALLLDAATYEIDQTVQLPDGVWIIGASVAGEGLVWDCGEVCP